MGWQLPIMKYDSYVDEPYDWVNISTMQSSSQINLLVSDKYENGVYFTVSSSAGCYIDFGDGTNGTYVDNEKIYKNYSGSQYGTPCNLGYNTWKLSIYPSGTLYSFRIVEIDRTIYDNANFVPIHKFILNGDIQDCSQMFYMDNYLKENPDLHTVIFNEENDISATSFALAFYQCANLRNVKLPISMSQVTSFANAFYICRLLSNDVIPKYAPQLSNLSGMYQATSIEEINWTGSVFSSSVDLGSTFLGCSKLKSVTLSTELVASASSLSSIFTSCDNLTYVDMGSSATSSAAAINSMFADCYSLETSSIKMPTYYPNATSIGGIFQNCYNFKTVPILDVPSVVGSNTNIYYGLKKITELTMPSLPNAYAGTTNDGTNGIFNYCTNLERIYNFENFGTNTTTITAGTTINLTNVKKLQELSCSCFIQNIVAGATAEATSSLRTLILHNETNGQFILSPLGCNISYCSFTSESINNLINSKGLIVQLPSVTGRHYPNDNYNFTITGNPEVSILTKFGSGSVNTNRIYMSDTSGLEVGMSLKPDRTYVSASALQGSTHSGNILFATTDIMTKTNHGFNVGDAIRSYTGTTGGIIAHKVYYVNNVLSTNTFYISDTPGGSNVDITANTSRVFFWANYITSVTESNSITVQVALGANYSGSLYFSKIDIGKVWMRGFDTIWNV